MEIEQAYNTILTTLQNNLGWTAQTELMSVSGEYSQNDWGEVYYSPETRKVPLAEHIRNYVSKHSGYDRETSKKTAYLNIDELKKIQTEQEACSFLSFTHYWGDIKIYTPQGYTAKVSEEERKELEKAASEFAASTNTTPGTMEFIKALKAALDQIDLVDENHNNPERRREEWAAHMHSGCADVYFNNMNYTSSKIAERAEYLNRIWNWLEINCPLLMMKYEEQQPN